MSNYLEEQIAGLSKMCEAIICWIHWDGDDGGVHEGHNAYPGSGCEHRTCRRYAEGLHMKTFGYVLPNLQELQSKVASLEMENDLLRRQIDGRGDDGR